MCSGGRSRPAQLSAVGYRLLRNQRHLRQTSELTQTKSSRSRPLGWLRWTLIDPAFPHGRLTLNTLFHEN